MASKIDSAKFVHENSEGALFFHPGKGFRTTLTMKPRFAKAQFWKRDLMVMGELIE